MFSKQQHEAIARVICKTRASCEDGDDYYGMLILEDGLSEMLGHDNPQFDAEEFAKVCNGGISNEDAES